MAFKISEYPVAALAMQRRNRVIEFSGVVHQALPFPAALVGAFPIYAAPTISTTGLSTLVHIQFLATLAEAEIRHNGTEVLCLSHPGRGATSLSPSQRPAFLPVPNENWIHQMDRRGLVISQMQKIDHCQTVGIQSA